MINKKAKLKENLFDTNTLEKKATRDGLGAGLLKLGETEESVVVLSADLKESTRANFFSEKFPERFIEVGVAEQNMATIASGLANYGKIPFITSFAVFSPVRNYDQIRTTICLNNVPVKIASTHAGVATGEDGATHQALEDIALMRVLPNMIVVQPADFFEAKKAVVEAAKIDMPIYLRFVRPKTPIFTSKDSPFKIGRAEVLYKTKNPDVLIISCGPEVYTSLLTAEELNKDGINSTVINLHTIKPLDEKTIIENAKEAGAVLTVEDHQVIGGLGSAVSELLSKKWQVPMSFVGIKDRFGQSGEPQELLEYYGLDHQSIAQRAKKLVQKKQA